MTNPTTDLWQIRARQLDAYRWALWRERYGLIGAAVRVVRDAILDFKYGIGARLRASTAPDSASKRILVLHGSPKLLAQRRKNGLIKALRERGHEVVEAAIEPLDVAIRQKLLYRPPAKVPLRYYAHAAYAEWLARHHQPGLVLSERHGSLVTPFLRLSLNAQDKHLAQLAHATTVERSRRLSMTDYDYYLLFGQSSLAALQRRTLRFGTTQAILTGSYLIDQRYDMPPATKEPHVLVLGVGPDKEKRAGYQRTYALIRDWAARHPEVPVSFKPHPRSPMTFWKDASAAPSNLRLLSPDMPLAEALEQSSVVLSIMSNAALEASLASRPVIYINNSEDQDDLEQTRFFGECVTSQEMLDDRLDWLCGHYQQALRNARAFADYHLAHGVHGQRKTAEAIDRLIHGQPLPTTRLEGTLG
ncbi:capsule biosynthesis protein [Pseudomonas huaxiensis]|uniref:capsule biosynthesis protein n=1 Tax=Pseudomonas huaxiensis TaxID=2213017 RepID=UPI000DA66162|nr:capsule biosynthesis protein [Pseudomonas huaxiensis]